MPRLRWRVRRTLLAVILYLAADCASLYNTIWHDSNLWLFVFLTLTLLGPMIVGLWWVLKWLDRSGNTLY